MLSGRYTEAAGRELFAAVGEATLLAAWMSYDSAPASALAKAISSRPWHSLRQETTACSGRASLTR
jgi:hypothetical protein